MDSATNNSQSRHQGVPDDAAFEAAARPWARYQEIVDNALAVTGAALAMLARLEPATGVVRTVGWAGLQFTSVQRALAAAERLFPQVNPTRVTTHVDVNPYQRMVFREGKAVAGRLQEVAAGVVDDRLLRIGETIGGIGHVFVCPLRVGNQVEGSLSMFTPTPVDEARRRTWEAFARQVALTLENAQLLERLQLYMQQLRDSEERYRSLVETSREGIVLTDLEANILMCNQQAVRLLDYDEAEILGRNALQFIVPEEHPRAEENMRKTLEAGSVKNLEYNLVRKDGSRVPVELSAALIAAPGGMPTSFMALVRDITGRKQAQQQLRQAAQIEARLEGVSLTAREMAHLLNNALVVPAGLIELLQEYGELPADLRTLVGNAAEDLAMAKQYIWQLQQVVRVQTRQTPLGPALDLARSVEEDIEPEDR